jgi:hypothetical protein
VCEGSSQLQDHCCAPRRVGVEERNNVNNGGSVERLLDMADGTTVRFRRGDEAKSG